MSPRHEDRKNSNERKPAKGLGDTMSSLASFANLEARFTSKTPFGEMAATNRSPSTEESEASGSDSDPSVDNMEQNFLKELGSLITVQRQRIEKYSQRLLAKRKKNKAINAFERSNLENTMTSLR